MTTVQFDQVLINGAQLTIRERGAGEPVLFVHGAMGDECAAVVTEPALVNQYRVIDYHRRGWGTSEKLGLHFHCTTGRGRGGDFAPFWD